MPKSSILCVPGTRVEVLFMDGLGQGRVAANLLGLGVGFEKGSSRPEVVQQGRGAVWACRTCSKFTSELE